MTGLLEIIKHIPPSILASLLVLALVAGYGYLTRQHRFWYRQGVYGEWLFPFIGPVWAFLTKDRLVAERERAKKYGKIYIETNIAGYPRLQIADPEIIRQILVKDFDNFPNHGGMPFPNKYEKLFLVWLRDGHWKRVRSMMSPTFTSGKIKRMFPFLQECANDLVENFREQSRDSMAIVNVQDTYGLYALNGITTCGYGIRMRRERGDTDLKSAATRNSFVAACLKVSSSGILRVLYLTLLPRFVLRWFNYKLTPESSLEPLIKRVEKIVRRRQKSSSAQENDNRHDDLLQMLIDAELDDKMELSDIDKMENHHAALTNEIIVDDQQKFAKEGARVIDKVSGKSRARLSELEVLSEAAFMLLAGMETTQTLLSNCTYALAYHPEIQEKLRQEIKKIAEVKPAALGGKEYTFSYEALTGCQYLDAVISETLRLMPPALKTDRYTENDYYIKKYKVRIPKGSQIMMGIYIVQIDPEYWEDPLKFKPDRFMPGEREKIVPGSYLPFGMGPRHCVGMRFSLTEAKIAMAKIILNFRFEPAPGLRFPPRSAAKLTLNKMKSPFVKIVPTY